MQTLQFTAEENWTVADLQTFLHQLNILYSRLYLIEQLGFDRRIELSGILISPISCVPDDAKLLIHSVEIQSPGKIITKGVSKILNDIHFLLKDWREIRRQNQLLKVTDWAVTRMKEHDFPIEERQKFIRESISKLNKPAGTIVKLMKKQKMTVLLKKSDDE